MDVDLVGVTGRPLPYACLAPDVLSDDYEGCIYLLSLRNDVLEVLPERETLILRILLSCSTLAEVIDRLSVPGKVLLDYPATAGMVPITKEEILTLLKRLRSQSLIKLQEDPISSPSEPPIRVMEPLRNKRLEGAGHILNILAEFNKGEQGLYRALLYLQKLKERWLTENEDVLSPEAAWRLARDEFWFCRLVTGFLERHVARLKGQKRGYEGLCMVQAFPLCAYLLALHVQAQIVIGRPKLGTHRDFKLHVWVDVNGRRFNEILNVEDRYRAIFRWPSF